jgi:hypothetical protein
MITSNASHSMIDKSIKPRTAMMYIIFRSHANFVPDRSVLGNRLELAKSGSFSFMLCLSEDCVEKRVTANRQMSKSGSQSARFANSRTSIEAKSLPKRFAEGAE